VPGISAWGVGGSVRFGTRRRSRCPGIARGDSGAGNAGNVELPGEFEYRRSLQTTRAGAVVLTADDAEGCPVAALIAPTPI